MIDYKTVVTLPYHEIIIKENEYGVATISIIPKSDKTMDTTVIGHDVNENVVRISTFRDIRTNALNVTRMESV